MAFASSLFLSLSDAKLWRYIDEQSAPVDVRNNVRGGGAAAGGRSGGEKKKRGGTCAGDCLLSSRAVDRFLGTGESRPTRRSKTMSAMNTEEGALTVHLETFIQGSASKSALHTPTP
ncbi:unnamed protein product [Pleuronectes platessa]|uniref:Uncharacterized protein n=1 Tax=Pleuronectes platessa TaxID=8262 RepID=A0A9N7UXR2_PLEPL|nr:unnamed protein product [Pleuronectes platessa]